MPSAPTLRFIERHKISSTHSFSKKTLTDPTTSMEICRFLHDSALLLIWGSAAFLGFLTPENLAAEAWSRLRPVLLTAAILAASTTAIFLPIAAAGIGNGWSDGIDLDTLRAVLLESSVGTAWQAQAATAVLLLLAFVTKSGKSATFVAVASALSLASLALNGHASIHQGWLSAIHRGNDILHLLAGGAWLGALLPLILMLAQLEGTAHQLEARIALRRFSTAGHIAVALVLASGVINTFLVLGRLPTDWTSPYQRLLAVKITAVCTMIGIAIVNRYRFVPAMAADAPSAIRAIRIGSILEIVAGLAVIGLVSVFGMLDPV